MASNRKRASCLVEKNGKVHWEVMLKRRVGMVTMSLVTLMALYTVVRKEVPQVSYISLLDLWMFSSMSFIVLILLHYVIISYFLSKHRNKLLPERINMIGIWGISFLFLSFCTIYWGFLIY
uniref:Neurotransmitter-gated ion-channel transmembrane domain-containing protein n=1 Tax=Lepeophtheirus salmonis TaxID=72036 RepID=A0A0K2U9A2_LEPSM